jgi:peroxiredoxin
MKQIFTAPRKLVIPLLVLALLGFLAFSLTSKTPAPDVTFTTIKGKVIPMAELKGKIVLVNFWATDCPGCIAEMPKLIETYNQYHQQGFEMVAVAMSYDPPSQVLNYTTKRAVPFPVMHDSLGEIASRFGNVNLTPTTFIIDKDGRIVRKTIGEMDFAALHDLLNEQLGKPGKHT